MSSPRPVEIVGGGLAGLSLGLALRRAAVPVTIFEAGVYPRHRVCGEFIAGLDTDTISRLGLDELLADARRHRTLAWFGQGRAAGVSTLPEPALGLSRYALDQRLAEAFVSAGGELLTRQRISGEEPREGQVVAAGRRRRRSSWIGLKCHVDGLQAAADLELHLTRHAYVGVSAVEDNHFNVCGLFHGRVSADSVAGKAEDLPLLPRLRACGLAALADRIESAQPVRASSCAVAALGFDRPSPRDPRVLIGDAFAMIPPFTGNGMAMAFQSAAAAVDPVEAWAKGEMTWNGVVRQVRQRIRQRFHVRLTCAGWLHGFMHHPCSQRWFLAANRAGLVPFSSVYRVLH